MNILPSGSSYTFTLNAWEQLTVTSRGGTTVTGPSGLLGTVDGTSTFGSYSVDTVITIAAVMNDCQYGVTEPENAQLSTDANNNTVLVGADGVKHALQLGSTNETVLLGDSLHAYGIGFSNGTNSNLPIGWCNDFLSVAGGVPFDIVDSFAAGGKTLALVISEQLALALASPATVAWLHVGINDLNPAIGNSTIAAMMTSYETIISQLSAAKHIVIIDSINPVSQSGSTGSKVRAYEIPQINAALRKLCANYYNVVFNNQYTALLDSTSASLNPVTNAVNSTDGIHYTSLGARIAGYASFENLASKITLTASKQEGTNLLPAFSGTGGTATGGAFLTITGTPPVGWELQGLSGASASNAVTISSFAPDHIRLVFANTGASAATTYLTVKNLQASIVRAATYKGKFGFQCSGNVGLNRIACSLRVNGSGADGYIINAMGQYASETPITYPQTAHGGVRGTPQFTLPDVALTNFEFIIAFNIAETSGAATIDIYAPELVRLT